MIGCKGLTLNWHIVRVLIMVVENKSLLLSHMVSTDAYSVPLIHIHLNVVESPIILLIIQVCFKGYK